MLMSQPWLGGCSRRTSTAGTSRAQTASATITPRIAADGGAGLVDRRLVSKIAEVGPLGAPDANGVRLPAGFRARVVARTRERVVAGKEYLWHASPDGGATFGTEDGGWIYVSNSEEPRGGGVGAIRFDRDGVIVDAYAILSNTSTNCAGGPTPWSTWLSCEEIAKGQVYECDPRGARPATVRPALGTFRHEAVTIDPIRHHAYLTEDEPDGCFYRFVPDALGPHGFADLSAGQLEVAVVEHGAVTWRPVPDPRFQSSTPTRFQVRAATHFNGGEGIWWHDGVVYFTTKGDNRVHAFDTRSSKIRVLYDAAREKTPLLYGVDNVTVSASADVLVAEDGGRMKIVAILPSGELKELMQLVGHPDSEITGPAFDPSGTRLYFSSQRGARGGTTFEITGPFHVEA